VKHHTPLSKRIAQSCDKSISAANSATQGLCNGPFGCDGDLRRMEYRFCSNKVEVPRFSNILDCRVGWMAAVLLLGFPARGRQHMVLYVLLLIIGAAGAVGCGGDGSSQTTTTPSGPSPTSAGSHTFTQAEIGAKDSNPRAAWRRRVVGKIRSHRLVAASRSGSSASQKGESD
jgi:hypothetical protein